jgi:glycogen debranching enzyme
MDYLVIKDGDTFLLTDLCGNIHADSEKGLYTHDTRCLDTYVLTLNGKPLSKLHSSCEKNYISVIHLTNDEEVNDGELKLHRESIEVKREQIVRGGVFYERMTFFNYARTDLAVQISLQFGSRFSDLFEARGAVRSSRGKDLPPEVQNGEVTLGYVGLDDVERAVVIRCDKATRTTANRFDVDTLIQPGKPFVLEVVVQPRIDGEAGEVTSFASALKALEADYAAWLSSCMRVSTDNESFNALIHRSLLDLRTLLTDLGDGPFPVAGIPWYAVPFGRDSLITALQMLPFQPEVAKGTLRTLARLQGEKVDAWRAEQPGKILHELRRGEMANVNEVPFQRYYGSIDSTPLFLVLAVEYYRWTNDRRFLEEILPNILRAVEWLDQYADMDGDGFVEYHSADSKGLSVQSWKDSYDSMIHPDGTLGVSPMAVSEVQGYVYHAKVGLSELLPSFGETKLAERLKAEAERLKEQFNDRFWMADKDYFATALDKDKRQIRTVTSDPGHCLWSAIIDADKVDAVVRTLLSPGMFSGWGIRTMSSDEAVYSPISYHNGSVWAHDNALILLGFAKYGQTDAVNTLTEALLRAGLEFRYQRLPELFCGHDASLGFIVRYPVACMPQAWAAGTPLAMFQAILGTKVDVAAKTITLSPTWPAFLSRIQVTNMPVGETRVSFTLDRDKGVVEESLNGYRLCVTQPE